MVFGPTATIDWLERLVGEFEFDVIGLARRDGRPFYPLPTEPGTLAHIVESRAADYLNQQMQRDPNAIVFRRGSQRGYPEIELMDGSLGTQIVALDIKVARRAKKPTRSDTE